MQFNKTENTKIYSKLDWVYTEQTDNKDNWCKYYDTLSVMTEFGLTFSKFDPFIFTYAIEVLGYAFYTKYLSRIDKFFARCYKLSYCLIKATQYLG